MKIIAETQRLLLREFERSDSKDLYDLNSDAEVLEYTGDIPFVSIEEAELFLNNYSDYKKNGFGRWAVILKESNDFLGWCGLKLNEENLIDLGFRFFQSEWGKGYATESAVISLDYGFNTLNLDCIIGRSSIKNIASIRVLEKLGMKRIKTGDFEGVKNAAYYAIDKTHFNKTNFPFQFTIKSCHE